MELVFKLHRTLATISVVICYGRCSPHPHSFAFCSYCLSQLNTSFHVVPQLSSSFSDAPPFPSHPFSTQLNSSPSPSPHIYQVLRLAFPRTNASLTQHSRRPYNLCEDPPKALLSVISSLFAFQLLPLAYPACLDKLVNHSICFPHTSNLLAMHSYHLLFQRIPFHCFMFNRLLILILANTVRMHFALCFTTWLYVALG